MKSPSIQLSDCPEGSMVEVVSFEMTDENIIRLMELGMTKACPLEIIRNCNKCPLIVACRSSQVIINRNISRQVLVREV